MYYIFNNVKGYNYELITKSSYPLKKAKWFMEMYEKDNPEYRGKLALFKKVD